MSMNTHLNLIQSTSILLGLKFTGADPGFLEQARFICIKVWGFAFSLFYLVILNIP